MALDYSKMDPNTIVGTTPGDSENAGGYVTAGQVAAGYPYQWTPMDQITFTGPDGKQYQTTNNPSAFGPSGTWASMGVNPINDPVYGSAIPLSAAKQIGQFTGSNSFLDKYAFPLMSGLAMGGIGAYNSGLSGAGGATSNFGDFNFSPSDFNISPYDNGPGIGESTNLTNLTSDVSNFAPGEWDWMNNPENFGGTGSTGFEGAEADTGITAGESPTEFPASGGSLWDSILNFAKSPVGGGVLRAGIGALGSVYTGNQLNKAATTAGDLANPLMAPQRQPYQAQLSQLLSNPTDFYNTNPVVKAQLDLARQQFNANTGKMGTGGTQFNDYLRNVQNVASGTFNDQANLLATLGGFNQGPGYSGVAYGNLAGKAADTRAQALYGIGQDIFGKVGQTNPNPTTGTPTNNNPFMSFLA